MPSNFKKRNQALKKQGYEDFKAGKPITAYYDLPGKHPETGRAAYNMGWKQAKWEWDEAERRKPVPLPLRIDQVNEITCAMCGTSITFTKDEVYRNGPSYTCKGCSLKPHPGVAANGHGS